MVAESEIALDRLVPPLEPSAKDLVRRRFQLPEKPHNGPTEREATVRIRAAQSFFRKAVVAAYGARCCVTGNPVPELLTASQDKVNLAVERRLTRLEVMLYVLIALSSASVLGIRVFDAISLFGHP